jgi:phosphate transport system ATP-binding protein
MKKYLEAKDLNVYFGKKQALSDVNISFPRNSVTALIGPSGCGKSTFLRTLNRIHELIPNSSLSGKIIYNNKDIYDSDVDPTWVRSEIGMVFQKPNPFPSMTIRQNVLAGLRLTGKRIKNEDDLVEECLHKAHLWNSIKDRLNDSALSLSGGQAQRLVIARALAVNPKVLLMDEPCSALDPASTLRIERAIEDLSKTMTIIIVTHNMQQALRVSEYTAFFLAEENKSGKIVEYGETKKIFEKAKDERTRNYVNGKFG